MNFWFKKYGKILNTSTTLSHRQARIIFTCFSFLTFLHIVISYCRNNFVLLLTAWFLSLKTYIHSLNWLCTILHHRYTILNFIIFRFGGCFGYFQFSVILNSIMVNTLNINLNLNFSSFHDDSILELELVVQWVKTVYCLFVPFLSQ